jgi:hypothetical protein
MLRSIVPDEDRLLSEDIKIKHTQFCEGVLGIDQEVFSRQGQQALACILCIFGGLSFVSIVYRRRFRWQEGFRVVAG